MEDCLMCSAVERRKRDISWKRIEWKVQKGEIAATNENTVTVNNWNVDSY
jgi:hypothetical protein